MPSDPDQQRNLAESVLRSEAEVLREPEMNDHPITNASLTDGFIDGYGMGMDGEPCWPPDHFTPAARDEWIIGWEYGSEIRGLRERGILPLPI